MKKVAVIGNVTSKFVHFVQDELTAQEVPQFDVYSLKKVTCVFDGNGVRVLAGDTDLSSYDKIYFTPLGRKDCWSKRLQNFWPYRVLKFMIRR